MTEEKRTVKLKNKLGMHARAAAAMVKIAQQFEAKIHLEHNGQRVDGDSILDILTLACPYGGELTIMARGQDAPAAVKALVQLVEDKFGES
ncbi:MAG TPA: HPr family phosphocarrier protein [Smithella sp.]|nr:HPr family phosphocarrier protein [Smithella sp.]HRS98108.1 HPr family phosphocarrier protein [Smithella sp.]